MTDTLLSTLQSVTEIDGETGTANVADVSFNILERSLVGVTAGDTLIRIPAERGKDSEGRHGWYLYGSKIDGDDETRAEVIRVASLGLEAFGYLAWDGDAA